MSTSHHRTNYNQARCRTPQLQLCTLATSTSRTLTGATRPPTQMARTWQTGHPWQMPHLFISGRWNTETNPDLAFAQVIGQEPLPVRHVLDRFPYSQHCPSLITTPSLVQSTERKPVRRWNFRKANWLKFANSTNTTAKSLPVPSASNINDSYVAYCTMLTNTAKKHIPRGVRKNYVPCWDKECEELLHAHNEAKTNAERARAATELITHGSTPNGERGGLKQLNQSTSPTPANECGKP